MSWRRRRPGRGYHARVRRYRTNARPMGLERADQVLRQGIEREQISEHGHAPVMPRKSKLDSAPLRVRSRRPSRMFAHVMRRPPWTRPGAPAVGRLASREGRHDDRRIVSLSRGYCFDSGASTAHVRSRGNTADGNGSRKVVRLDLVSPPARRFAALTLDRWIWYRRGGEKICV